MMGRPAADRSGLDVADGAVREMGLPTVPSGMDADRSGLDVAEGIAREMGRPAAAERRWMWRPSEIAALHASVTWERKPLYLGAKAAF